MRSAIPRCCTIGGRPCCHALATARGVDPQHLVVVVRHGRDAVAAEVAELDPDALVADQDEVKGTGRAVWCGLQLLPAELAGTVIVTNADVPLLTPATLAAMVAGTSARSWAPRATARYGPHRRRPGLRDDRRPSYRESRAPRGRPSTRGR